MLEDSSFAIRPTKNGASTASNFFDIGSLLSFERTDHVFKLKCEKGFVTILFYQDDIVRITMNPFAHVSLQTSPAVVNKPENVDISVLTLEHEIQITSKKLTLLLQRSPFRVTILDKNGVALLKETSKGMGYTNDKEVICFKDMLAEDCFYGLGEKTGYLNKRGATWTMWNSDVYAPHNPETNALYQSIPYFMTIRNGHAHGVYFDNTYRTTFDFQSETTSYSFKAEGGQLDYYFFAGPSPKEVLKQYTALTGRIPLPPKWALGYHQSKYSYKSEQEVKELADTFLEKNIPLDAIFLDIHYMDNYRVFTFDRTAFPDPKQLITYLKDRGIHVVPIVDPGVKRDPAYKQYQDGIIENHFCKYIEGSMYFGEVWPGLSAFPDFSNTSTQKWWGDQHRFYTDMGIEGIWNDMNEPAVFNKSKTMDLDVIHNNDGNPITHKEFHNLYGLLMGKATYEGLRKQLKGKRPFLLTRAGFAGIQRYAAVWTGDNRSFWQHLQLALPMCMNMGLSGLSLCGPDVGGFAHDCDGELLTRWTQAGAFFPYFRNHNALDTIRQEPWAFGEKYERIIKKYIELRYQWLPHLYSLFADASRTGIPVMRPLVMEYPTDEQVRNLSDQFLIGDNVLIAPIMQPDTYHRAVYLPEGEWVNYWTDEVLSGNQHILVHADIETLPIYIKRGTCIAHGTIRPSTTVPLSALEIHVYPAPSGETSYTLYDDNGVTFDYQQGAYYEKQIQCQYSTHALDINIHTTTSSYKPEWSNWKIIIHQANEDMKVTINGSPVSVHDPSIEFHNQRLEVLMNHD